jgi:hypothetical protein
MRGCSMRCCSMRGCSMRGCSIDAGVEEEVGGAVDGRAGPGRGHARVVEAVPACMILVKRACR